MGRFVGEREGALPTGVTERVLRVVGYGGGERSGRYEGAS